MSLVPYEVNGVMVENPKLEETESWKTLIHESREARAMITKSSLMLTEGYFDLGCLLLKYKTDKNKLGLYGDNVLNRFIAHFNRPENLVNGIRLHKTSIYEAVTVAEDCDGKIENLYLLLDNLEKRGKSRTWTSVRNRKVLLGTGKNSKADPKQARSQGGEEQQAHNLLSDFESAHIMIKEYNENGIPEDQKKQVAGATALIAIDAITLAEKIQPGIIFKDSSVAAMVDNNEISDAEFEEVPSNTPLTEDYIDSKFSSDLMLSKCVCHGYLGEACDDVSLLRAFPSQGDGLIALCLAHANLLKSRGPVSFFSTYRSFILKWYGDMMKDLHRQKEEWREAALQLTEDPFK